MGFVWELKDGQTNFTFFFASRHGFELGMKVLSHTVGNGEKASKVVLPQLQFLAQAGSVRRAVQAACFSTGEVLVEQHELLFLFHSWLSVSSPQFSTMLC